MRLFVAVGVSEETRAALRDLRGQLEPQLHQAARPPRVTWVNPSVAHVTVRFIGDVDDTVAADITTALSAPFGQPAFTAIWTTVGAFPQGRSPRVVWLGGTAGQDEFAALARDVNARLDGVIGPGESRPFRAHVTIGRVKDPGRGVDWPRLLTSLRVAPIASVVDRLTLYRSRTSPTGPAYDAVATWMLSSR